MKSLRNHCALIPASTGRKLAKGILAICCAGSLGLGVGNARAEAQFGGEFWISTNATSMIYSSGVVYSNGIPVVGGTLDNPLDGSSQTNLDQNLNNLPYGATIHILAGNYQTLGSDDWSIKCGQKIIGSGIDHTILKLIGTDTGRVWVISSGGGLYSTNAAVRDLTCDANGTASVVYHEGISLNGTEFVVSHVKVINCSSTGEETFGISILTWPLTNSVGNLIEDCEVADFQGGSGMSAIAMAGGYSNTGVPNSISGVIRNNRVYLNPNWSSQFGINTGFITHSRVEGNYVEGANCGLYCDTGGITNTLFAHNILRDCCSGVAWANNTWLNDTFAFNNIEVTNATAASPAAFFFEGSASGTNLNIIGNVVHYVGQSYPFTPKGGPMFVEAYNVTGLNVANNTVDSVMTNYVSNVSNLNMYNNVDLLGNYIAGDNNSIGAYPISDAVYALLDSTNSAQVLTNLGLPALPSVILTNMQTGVTLSGTFAGNGSSLTGLNASQLTSGTVPLAQLPGGVITNNCTTPVYFNDGLAVNQPGVFNYNLTVNGGGMNIDTEAFFYQDVWLAGGVLHGTQVAGGQIYQSAPYNNTMNLSLYMATNSTATGAVPDFQFTNSVQGNPSAAQFITPGTVVAATLSAKVTFLSTNAVCPSPLAGGGWLWNSNNAIYWVTASHTNYIAGP